MGCSRGGVLWGWGALGEGCFGGGVLSGRVCFMGWGPPGEGALGAK